MTIRRTAHAVYGTKYHLVWAPKYRKWVKREEIRDKAREIFSEVAENYGFEIQEMRVAPDHVHIFLGFPPKYSILPRKNRGSFLAPPRFDCTC